MNATNPSTDNILSIMQFLKVTQNLKSFKRHNWTTDGERETVAAHSWGLAIFFVLFCAEFNPKINMLRALELLIIHDIGEAFQGDIPRFLKNNSDSEKEDNWALKLIDTLPENSRKHMTELYNEFSEQKTIESRYAKAFDKLETQIQHLFSGSNYWNVRETGKHMLTYPEHALANADDDNLKKIWEIIKKQLQEETDKLMGSN